MAEESKTKKTTATKAPQDRKPKQEKAKAEKVELEVETGERDESGKPKIRTVEAFRVTVQSLTVHVPVEAINDYEVIEILADAQRNGETPMHISGMMQIMLSEADHKRVKEALRGPNGRVSMPDITKFYMEMMQAINPSS